MTLQPRLNTRPQAWESEDAQSLGLTAEKQAQVLIPGWVLRNVTCTRNTMGARLEVPALEAPELSGAIKT